MSPPCLASASALAEVKIDGELTEPEWERAQVFTDFRVTQPYTLGAPRYPTEARLLGTPQGIVVGFRCTHPPATPRQLAQTPRDADNNGDRVNLYIDFNADAQVAYNVTIALAGSLQDATLTNENQYSTDWDSDVEYAIRQTDEEWFVELLLPWTTASMKNADAPKRTIGIAFDRVIGATQERSALQGVSFTQPRYVSEFPKVEIDQYPGSVLHFFPYASVANDLVGDEVDMKLGADIQWKPSANFQLTAALNPDFGQVEADELVVNFDAIEVLFSDKRPFFAENQALFDIRVPETDTRVTARDRLLYTRRIGGQRDDDPLTAADIDGAVKLNGNVGPSRLRRAVCGRRGLRRRHRTRIRRHTAAIRIGSGDARLSRHVGRPPVPRQECAGPFRGCDLAAELAADAAGTSHRQHDRPVLRGHLR